MPLPTDEDGRVYTLAELDALHAYIGLGPEWLASEARAELVAEVTVPGEVVPNP